MAMEIKQGLCYIDDLIDGIMKLINIDYNLPVNLGNDDEVSINYVANKIINLLNSSSKIVYNKLPKDDPLKRKPDISVAKKLLDWKPKINKEIGFKMLIEYYKKNNLI